MTKIVKPPLRDRGRDDYAEGFDIEYEVGSMRVNGVKWVYHIYQPQSEPTQEYGIIGDIAKFEDSFWFHDARRWREADEDVDETERPRQKHPLLKGRYRFDCNKLKWRNSSSYRAAYLMKIGRTKESELKREYQSPQPAILRRIKGEPVHIDLSRDDSWTLRENHNGDGQTDRQTILIDLTLEENASPRRIAFLLPPSRSARLAHRAPSPGPSRSATPPQEDPAVASPPPSEDSMYTDSRPVVPHPILAAAPEPTLRADVEVQTEYSPRMDRSTSVPRTDLQRNAQERPSNQNVITPRPSEPASSAVDNRIPTGWESVSTNTETVFGPPVLSDITSAVTQQDIEEIPNTRNDLPPVDISDPNFKQQTNSDLTLDLGWSRTIRGRVWIIASRVTWLGKVDSSGDMSAITWKDSTVLVTRNNTKATSMNGRV
ncbi:hypothetical protein GALMADRAFT_1294481 [Galerina marginata CBS 339.88]|uniref:Uncharacterized protein n=1 Tax=Galerina marginata (strain CBS 339.88) TaxID=685588 RepID=A0A067T4B9_GALM3|nr:hypothetical protein GALMADRAFT_1294481 [Galerina marginata CBS 339.88]